MDGVTDAAMRFIAKKYGKPDIIYTEFVSAEGLWRIKKRGEMENKIWQDLRFDKTQGPTIVQLFGSDPESFYESAKIVCELGFDGIDINMGCPSKGLEKRGGGAGLIRDKCNAVEVVEATRRGVADFFGSDQSNFSSRLAPSTGASLRQNWTAPAPAKINNDSATSENNKAPAPKEKTQELKNSRTQDDVQLVIPVSVKTRIGSDKPDVEWWHTLAGMKLPAVAMHGRTFKQLYSGEANWEELFKAAEVIRESGALFLGNGDVQQISVRTAPKPYSDLPQAGSRLRAVFASAPAPIEFAVELKDGRKLDLTGRMDGVLIGRGAIGNPWILNKTQNEEIKEKLRVAVEHARKFEEVLPEQKFFVMRKHLVGYCTGFPEASELRKKLVMTNNADEVEREIKEWLDVKK